MDGAWSSAGSIQGWAADGTSSTITSSPAARGFTPGGMEGLPGRLVGRPGKSSKGGEGFWMTGGPGGPGGSSFGTPGGPELPGKKVGITRGNGCRGGSR